jgi:branched-chain amino acid transport system permease protein
MHCPAYFVQNNELIALFSEGLANGFLYALIAIGYTLVYGVLRLINFAHSEVFMMGGFGAYFALHAAIGDSTPSGWTALGWIAVGLTAGGLAGGATAYGLERVAYRPLRRRGAPKFTYLIAAIGASLFLQNFAGKEFGRIPVFIPKPALVSGNAFSVCGAPIEQIWVLVVIISLLMLVFADTLVNRTKLGRGIRAVAQDGEVASLMGVNIDRTIATTFILGGILGGAAGCMWGMQYGVSYQMGFIPGIKAFTAAVLGGIGNLRGAMLGGILLGLVEAIPLKWMSSSWQDVVAFGVLVVVLMFRPTGILGERLGRVA